MFDALYECLRGAIGFSLIVGGASLRLAHAKERGLGAFGGLCLAVGALFSMSALDSFARLPVDLDNLVFQSLMLVLGLAVIDISLYVFGPERNSGGRKRLARAGAAYAAALAVLPLLDYALGLGSSIANVEDGLVRGPVHAAATNAAYLWPIAATIASIRIARWKPADVASTHPESRRLIIAFRAILLVLAAILASLFLSLRIPYRLAHLVLELLLLAMYFYVVKNPRALMRLRAEIEKEGGRRLSLGEEEAALIEKRLEGIAEKREIVLDEGFDLRRLAELLGLPAYRLSAFFGSRLGTSFPAWRNRLRIDYVRERMAERPDLTILEISLEAGYRSKASFNEQFGKIAGMSPSEYRKTLGR